MIEPAMHTNPVTEYVTGPSPDLTVVLAHGRTLNPAYMQALAERLQSPNVRFLLPAADGNSWYPKGFLSPIEENEPYLSAALDHYEGIVARLLAEGTDPLRIVVGGFSQGACLTAEYLHRFPRRLGGAILWTGGLIGPDGTQWTPRPQLEDMQVYLTTSETDPFVPPGRVRTTVDWLREGGAQVTAKIFVEREHHVSDEEIECGRNLLREVRRGVSARSEERPRRSSSVN
jgi:phospholipase/carboxylesterase